MKCLFLGVLGVAIANRKGYISKENGMESITSCLTVVISLLFLVSAPETTSQSLASGKKIFIKLLPVFAVEIEYDHFDNHISLAEIIFNFFNKPLYVWHILNKLLLIVCIIRYFPATVELVEARVSTETISEVISEATSTIMSPEDKVQQSTTGKQSIVPLQLS